MKPINFSEQNCIFAKDQPQYLSLPTYKDVDGVVTSCWKLSIWERICVLFTGQIWCRLVTFNQPLQPQRLAVEKPKMV